MVSELQLQNARDLLEKSQRPIYFFDDDADGTCSFLQLYKYYKKGLGIIVKDSKTVETKYFDTVKYQGADLIILLDKPMVEMAFLNIAEENGIPVIMVDHHPPVPVTKKTLYINPMLQNPEDNRSTSYWVSRIIQEVNWLGATGSITDYTWDEPLVNEFKKLRPDLLPPKTKNVPEAMNNTQIGILGMIINSNVRGKTKSAMASVKTLTRIDSPDEILEQTTAPGRFIWKKYQKYKEFYDGIKSLVKITKDPFIYVRYANEEQTVSSALATEISSNHPEKVVIIARDIKEDVAISIRCQALDIASIASTASQGLKGRTGGHKHAIGGLFTKDDFEIFLERLKKEIKP